MRADNGNDGNRYSITDENYADDLDYILLI